MQGKIKFVWVKWDKSHDYKGKHVELQFLWIRPFTVHENLGQHTYHLQYLDGNIDSLHVNGQDLKQYSRLWSRVMPYSCT